MQYSFEKLDAWQYSKEFVIAIYMLTKKFPSDEKFGLISQLRRSAVSVSSNIAEGSTRWGKKDKARFYEIAFGSLIEALNQIILAKELNYITTEELDMLRPKVDAIGRMLHALRNSTKSKEKPKRPKPKHPKPNNPKPNNPNTQTPKHPITQTPKHPITQTPKHPITQTPKHLNPK